MDFCMQYVDCANMQNQGLYFVLQLRSETWIFSLMPIMIIYFCQKLKGWN